MFYAKFWRLYALPLVLCTWSVANRVQADDFACWVTVRDGHSAFVLLEASDVESARRMASRAKARLAHGKYSTVVEVRECIDRLHQQFHDGEARTRWINHPL